MKGDSIDVLIPSFRGERYLPLCLLALGQSTFRDVTIRLGPEGPWDSGPLVKKLCRALSLSIVVDHSPNRLGLAQNRIRLLRASSSDLILWLDDDVLVSPDSIGRLLDHRDELGVNCSVLTGVGSNLFGHPTVTCALGFTLFRRTLLLNDPVLEHDFGLNTGEDCLWTAKLAYKTGLPIRFVPTRLHHIGESRRRKRYGVQWNGGIIAPYTSLEFYETNREELDYSHPVYNYVDY